MSRISIDEVVSKLSVKFNRIFYDRDFVGCVSEDLQTLIDNTHKCCVLVFPTLSPNYLRVVRYQAKLCDLAVITLGSGIGRSVGVCHKKFCLPSPTKLEDCVQKEELGAKQMAESATTRKKRPPIQLYVPPAQRKSRLSVSNEKHGGTQRPSKSEKALKKSETTTIKEKTSEENTHDICFCPEDINYLLHNQNVTLSFSSPYCNCVKFSLFKDIFPFAKLQVFSINRMKHSFHWVLQEEIKPRNILVHDSSVSCTCPSEDFEEHSFTCFTNELLEQFLNCLKSGMLPVIDLETYLVTIRSTELPIAPYEEDKSNCDISDACATLKTSEESSESIPKVDQVIVLEERKEQPKTNNVQKTPQKVKDKEKKKHNEHEQEKEIMRKAQQNINRKTRPIIKYVDDDNDTLKIGKGENINNWEELFNDDGELQEDIFTEIVQKVGPDVTIMKASEDYSAYGSKPREDLEHMVELYDFPATLETRDIIAAFSEVNSDSMYVKWVDDTHAILVLGSSIQAQRAIELSSQFIKVRPMTTASSMTLEKANQFDLKPAMKRPQTNLQTARRLITSHLGAKSRVSKEQSAKEREDLRIAKELKKQAKQNEKAAWEGNLQSSIK